MPIVHTIHIYLCKSNFATLKLGELSSWSHSFAVSDLTSWNNYRVSWLNFLVWVRAQGHWARLLSQAKLGGKKRKTRLKVRNDVQEEGKVSDKSTIFAARNITREHVWIITVPLKREECEINILILVWLLMQFLNSLLWLCAFLAPCYAFYQFLRLLVWKPDFGGDLSKKLSKVDISAIF